MIDDGRVKWRVIVLLDYLFIAMSTCFTCMQDMHVWQSGHSIANVVDTMLSSQSFLFTSTQKKGNKKKETYKIMKNHYCFESNCVQEFAVLLD